MNEHVDSEGMPEEAAQAAEAEEERAFQEEYESEIEADSSNLIANKEEQTPQEEPEQAAAEEPAAEPEEPDRFTQLEEKLSQRMRNLEGHFGGLKSQLQAAMEARQETKDQGGNAPTKTEIKEASKSSEKLDQLREDFPEWADALDEQFGNFNSQIAETYSPDKIQESMSEMMNTTLGNSISRLRQIIQIDMKYPGWEETINTDGFKDWKDSQSEEIQALADSHLAKDAIAMLDAYHQTLEKENQAPTNGAGNERNKQRLADSVAPTRGAGSRQVNLPSDEEDFIAAFNST